MLSIFNIADADGHKLLSSSRDGTCKLWDNRDVECIDINKQRSLFISYIYLHDYRIDINNRFIKRFRGHTSHVDAIK